MSEEKKEIKFYPEPTVGVMVYNDKGEILLIQHPRWGDYWNFHGGHIEIGESMEDAVKRESKEEVNLEVDEIEFLGLQEAIFPKENSEKKHFIFLDFSARLAGGEVKKSDENLEFVWIKPEDALKILKLNPYTKVAINKFLNKPSTTEVLENKYKRALADYQNLLKQTAKEKDEFAKYANEKLLSDLLPAFNQLDSALNINEKDEEFYKGIKLLAKLIMDIFIKMGVVKIKTIGEKFDHNTMLALKTVPTDDKTKDEIVVEEYAPGFLYNDKLITTASVAVYKYKEN